MNKKLFTLACLLLVSLIQATARETYNFNSDWRISKESPQGKGKVKNEKTVTLPHAWNEDEAFKVSTYETTTAVVWYRKTFRLPAEAEGKKVFIEFEGARQAAEVFLNGQRLGIHENGTMAFGFDLTPYIKYKEDNLIEVRTDNAWNYKEQATGANFQWHTKAFNVNYGGLHFWSWGYGYLYKVKTYLTDKTSQFSTLSSQFDEVVTTTGFRKTEFKQGMIYLNDRVMMVHGYAQRTTNEWPGVGMSVPAWVSDYSNDLFVKSGGNVVRWMHTCPWKQDSESCYPWSAVSTVSCCAR